MLKTSSGGATASSGRSNDRAAPTTRCPHDPLPPRPAAPTTRRPPGKRSTAAGDAPGRSTRRRRLPRERPAPRPPPTPHLRETPRPLVPCRILYRDGASPSLQKAAQAQLARPDAEPGHVRGGLVGGRRSRYPVENQACSEVGSPLQPCAVSSPDKLLEDLKDVQTPFSSRLASRPGRLPARRIFSVALETLYPTRTFSYEKRCVSKIPKLSFGFWSRGWPTLPTLMMYRFPGRTSKTPNLSAMTDGTWVCPTKHTSVQKCSNCSRAVG